MVTSGKIVHSHRLVYGVQFLTENNKTVAYEVPQNLYDELSPRQKGLPATVEGEFYAFGNVEEI